MSSGSTTIAQTVPSFSNDDSIYSSTNLPSSFSSLPSSSSRQQTSQIAKTYRQAAQLFLTKRFPEALSTIEPIITPQPASTKPSPSNEQDADDDDENRAPPPRLAPVATASKTTRTKVWSFYLTFLNSVIELGPEEGKHAFGTSKWKSLVCKTRDGSVWADIVRDGYAGNEGAVDADVVIDLATLLLTHAPDQRLTQQRMETYLTALSNPTFDVASHMAAQSGGVGAQRLRKPQSASGTNTPRDLHTHLKLLELYTLHVLPRNGEWDYAREVIMMSEVLDDERKEAFLHALHGLKEEQENAAKREEELMQRRKEELEARRRREEEEQQERRRLDEERKKDDAARTTTRPQRPPDATATVNGSVSRAKPSSVRRINDSSASTTRQPKKDVTRRKQPSTSLYARAISIFTALQSVLLQTAQGLANNPMALLRTMLFLLAFALAFGRREIREKVRRLLERAWEKLRGTVRMGVKVSYL